MIEASGDRYADFSSSGDSPTVIRPPSPSIEGAGEESTRSMVQVAAAEGVEEGGEAERLTGCDPSCRDRARLALSP